MVGRPLELEYRSDRLIGGRLLTQQLDPGAKDLSAEHRLWLGSDVAIIVRPEYREFQCKKCGVVDELSSFRAGLPKDFKVPKPRPDLHVSEEYIDIWSRRLADCVLRFASSYVDLFELPGDREYVVPWPKEIEGVPKGARVLSEDQEPGPVAFRPYAGRCKRCGRYGFTTFWSEFYRPSKAPLSAVGIYSDNDPPKFMWMTWIVGAELGEAIRRGKFSNVSLEDSFFREGRAGMKKKQDARP